jgi:hypothetical protein
MSLHRGLTKAFQLMLESQFNTRKAVFCQFGHADYFEQRVLVSAD